MVCVVVVIWKLQSGHTSHCLFVHPQGQDVSVGVPSSLHSVDPLFLLPVHCPLHPDVGPHSYCVCSCALCVVVSVQLLIVCVVLFFCHVQVGRLVQLPE